MATGITRNITEDTTFTSKYEMTAYDDILNIIGATVTLAKPAGDIFTNEGNDTVTVKDSTITVSALGLSFFLGSGDDALNIQNSTINAPTLTGSGNDTVVITGDKQSKVVLKKQGDDEYTLNLGANDDVLELQAILEGDGDVTFGTGRDTLRFNGGSLLTTGNFGTFSVLDVLSTGGSLGRSLTLAGTETQISLKGILLGTSAGKYLAIADSTTELITADNIRTNVTLSLSNVNLTQSEGGTLEFSGHAGYAITANDSTVILHDIVTQSGQVFAGTNSIWKIKDSNFSNSTTGISLTNGEIELNNVGLSDYTDRAMRLNGTKLTGSQLAFTNNKNNGAIFAENSDFEITDLRMNGNIVTASASASASAYAYAYAYASASGPKTVNVNRAVPASASADAKATAMGGAISHFSGSLTLTSANFSENIASASATAFASAAADADAIATAFIKQNTYGAAIAVAFASAYAFAPAYASATAMGGAISHTSGNLILTSANFSENIASAYVTATGSATGSATGTCSNNLYTYGSSAYAYSSASAHVTASSTALCTATGADAGFSRATATTSAYVTAIAGLFSAQPVGV